MRTGAASTHHNENDVTVIIAGWIYGDWRHVAMGCTVVHCSSLFEMYSVLDMKAVRTVTHERVKCRCELSC